jgi:hypothetical protein
MKHLSPILILVLTGCATASQEVFKCVVDHYGETQNTLVAASNLDQAVKFYKAQNPFENQFYCTRMTWKEGY